MNRVSLRLVVGLLVLDVLMGASVAAAGADEPEIGFKVRRNRVAITAGGQPLATYVFRDEKISRPYFAHVHAPGGVQVTRNHPPVPGRDATDHATFHPGIWLAFGDISGHDDWRLKARVVHDAFVEEPQGGAGGGGFAVRNRYLSSDGKHTVCTETCRLTMLVRPAGFFVLWDSTFTSGEGEFLFGDQEEMGLGVRVATPIAVRGGGRIVDAQGRVNEKQVWGNTAAWCDYSGPIAGRHAGITLMPHPANFRPCWFHARDYGFVAANPFGRKAFGKGAASKVVVKRGESLRLRWGVLLYSSDRVGQPDLGAAYRDYLSQSGEQK